MPRTTKGGPGGKVSAHGGGSDQLINVRFRIEGLDRTSDQFKRVRRDINARMRDVMVRVGERELLPDIRQDFPKRPGSGKMASSLKIQRERSGVFVSSSLRGQRNRALGWVDFGGRRPRDTFTRRGTKVIFRNIDAKRQLIDTRVLEGVVAEFRDKGFDAS